MSEGQPGLVGRESKDWRRPKIGSEELSRVWAWGLRPRVGILFQMTGKEVELLSGTTVSVHMREAVGIHLPIPSGQGCVPSHTH